MRSAKCEIGFISLALHSQGIVKYEIKCLRHAIKFASKRNKEPVGFTIKSLSAHNKVPCRERIKAPLGRTSFATLRCAHNEFGVWSSEFGIYIKRVSLDEEREKGEFTKGCCSRPTAP